MYLLAYFILKLEKTEEFIKTMDNPETLATLDTQDTERRQTKQNQNRKMKLRATQTPPNYRGRILVLVKGRQFLF